MKKILSIIIALCLLMSSSIMAFASSGGVAGAQQKEKEIKSLNAELKKHFGDQNKRRGLIKKIVELKKKNDKNKSKDSEENLYYVYVDGTGEIVCEKSSVIKYFDKTAKAKYVIPVSPITKGMGAILKWNETTHTLTVVKDSNRITIDFTNTKVTKNGQECSTDIFSKKTNKRAIVLVKTIANLLGYKTDTDGDIVVIDPPSTNNVALLKPAYSDSEEALNKTSYGNDGNITTRWCAGNGNTGHQWKVDLQGLYNLTGSEIMWEFSKVYKYIIEVSPDDSNWTKVVEKNNNTGNAQIQADNFDQNLAKSVRYVRVTINGLEQGSWASFYEFRVFGSIVTVDTQAPTTPANLNAAAVTNSQISLSWTASTDNIGVVKYRVYRDNTQIAEVTNGTTYQDNNLTAGNAYKYTVSAVDAANNESPKSSELAVSTLGFIEVNDNTTGTGLNQFNYSQGWSYGTQSGAYSGDNHWSDKTGSYFEIKFYGTQINLYAAKAPNHGIAKITIDGILITYLDLYAQTRADNTLIYISPNLPRAEHTLRVEVTGDKNGSATNCFIPADRVEIIN